MKRQLIINISRLLTLCGFIFLAACSATPEKETAIQGETAQEIIFNKAKSAFLSRNYKVASALFSNLAEKGHADAQYSLGYMYYYGTGLPSNLKQAMHWFNLSAAQGNNNAATALVTIQKMVADNKQIQNPASDSQAPPLGQQTQDNNQTAVIDLRSTKKTNAAIPNTSRPVTRPEPAITRPEPVVTRPEPAITRPEPVVTRPEPVIAQPKLTTSTQATATTQLNDPKEKQSSKEIKSSQWILKQPSGYYTIQLASSTSRKKTLDFIRRVELDGVYFFRTAVNDIERYTVIHGSFPKYGMAKAKLSLLKKRGYKNVWIRGMRGIKTAINRQ